MNNIFILLVIFFFSLRVIAQVPSNKIWDFRYGGNSTEDPRALLYTSDGGYLVCGWSLSSASFDKTDTTRSLGAADYWVVKTDSLGNLLWENTFGGDLYDSLTCAIALPDSGFLIGGFSNSNISGEKSQPNFNPVNRTKDYWIVRVDKNGNKMWDKTFGGFHDDNLNSLLFLPDGNFLLGGFTKSDSTGDMSHHTFNTSPTLVTGDYWIIKVDLNGNKIWDRNYGGSKSDELISLGLSSDHGFILAGKSNSSISGTKTQPAYNNGYDFWIVKTDSNGVQLWDKTIGSGGNDQMSCFKITPSQNLIIGGITNSGAGFDKSDAGNGLDDFWFVYTNPMGVKIWDNAYGGNQKEDDVNGVAITTNGFVITGASYSNISGDKSENNILSNEQAWMIAVDNFGNKLWDKTFNCDTHVEFATALQTPDGCYTILSHVNMDGGDVSQARNSEYDYWLAKFCPNPLPTANFIASSNSTCQNSCVNFTNLSLNSTSYHWFFPG